MKQKSGSKAPISNSYTPAQKASPAGCGAYSPMTPKGANSGKSPAKKKSGSKGQ